VNADLLAAEKTAPEFRQLTHALVSVTEKQTKIRRNLDLFFLVATPESVIFQNRSAGPFFLRHHDVALAR
jgi:hypothetical protein